MTLTLEQAARIAYDPGLQKWGEMHWKQSIEQQKRNDDLRQIIIEALPWVEAHAIFKSDAVDRLADKMRKAIQ